jgi:DNA repair protein RecO (recombination protein O)
MVRGGEADWDAVFAGLAITGHFLARDILVGRVADPLAARARLVDRMKRAVA